MKKESKNTMLLAALLIIVLSVIEGCDVMPNEFPNVDPNKYGRVFMPQAREEPVIRPIDIYADSIQSLVYSATYGGPKRTSVDNITVQFSVDTTLVDVFNTKNQTSYLVLPKSSYTMGKTAATIPFGELSTPKLKLGIKANGNLKNAAIHQYLLPITMNVKDGGVKVNKDLQTTYFLIRASYSEYSKTGWQVISYDSQQPGFPASNIIDNDTTTFLNTAYDPAIDPLPHNIVIDMGKEDVIHGFRILGRPIAQGQNPKDIAFQFSNDGTQWKDGEDFTLPFDFDKAISATIFLANPVEARYFRIIIKANLGGWAKITTIREVYAF